MQSSLLFVVSTVSVGHSVSETGSLLRNDGMGGERVIIYPTRVILVSLTSGQLDRRISSFFTDLHVSGGPHQELVPKWYLANKSTSNHFPTARDSLTRL
jgi:hypothetical protein